MEWIIKATNHRRWLQKYEHEVALLTGTIDDAQMFKTFEEAEQAVIDIGRSDMEVNGHIYYEDLP